MPIDTATRFLLIPGAGGSAWYWHLVLAELERCGAHATAVELPADDETAGLAEYLEVAAAVAPAAPFIAVGQSMGSYTALGIAARLEVRLVVLLNGMVPLPDETAGDWWSATGQGPASADVARAQGRDPEDEDPAVIFLHDVPDEVVTIAPEQKSQSGRPFQDAIAAGNWPDVQVQMLTGTDDRLFPASFQQRLGRERLGVEAKLIPGGHCAAPQLPDSCCRGLDRAVAGGLARWLNISGHAQSVESHQARDRPTVLLAVSAGQHVRAEQFGHRDARGDDGDLPVVEPVCQDDQPERNGLVRSRVHADQVDDRHAVDHGSVPRRM